MLLAGELGAGKCTLLRALNGLVPHFYGGRIAGRVRVAGHGPGGRGPGDDEPRSWAWSSRTPKRRWWPTRLRTNWPLRWKTPGCRPTDAQAHRRSAGPTRPGTLRGRRVSSLSGGERQRVAIGAVLTLATAGAGTGRADLATRPAGRRRSARHAGQAEQRPGADHHPVRAPAGAGCAACGPHRLPAADAAARRPLVAGRPARRPGPDSAGPAPGRRRPAAGLAAAAADDQGSAPPWPAGGGPRQPHPCPPLTPRRDEGLAMPERTAQHAPRNPQRGELRIAAEMSGTPMAGARRCAG